MFLTAIIVAGLLMTPVDRPQAPIIMHAPHVMTEADELCPAPRTPDEWIAMSARICAVRIVPHADIRVVILEVYETASEDDGACTADLGELIRSSLEPVADQRRTIYPFDLRLRLRAGCYALVARVACGGAWWGLTFASHPRWMLEVR